MATTTADNIQIIGGVDTHQDLHTAAVVSHDGTVLGTESFSTTRAGYRAMLRWFRSHGELLRVGVESTGTYGAGITRHLALSGTRSEAAWEVPVGPPGQPWAGLSGFWGFRRFWLWLRR